MEVAVEAGVGSEDHICWKKENLVVEVVVLREDVV